MKHYDVGLPYRTTLDRITRYQLQSYPLQCCLMTAICRSEGFSY